MRSSCAALVLLAACQSNQPPDHLASSTGSHLAAGSGRPPSPSATTSAADSGAGAFLPSAPAVEKAKVVAAVQTRLQKMKVFVRKADPKAESLEYDVVPPDARAALRELKDAILAVAEAEIPQAVTQPRASRALDATFEAGGAQLSKPGSGVVNGAVSLSLDAVPDHEDRWVLSACVEEEPGSDCMVALYERRAGVLRLMLVSRNDDYESILGARQGAEWAVSPPLDDKIYLVHAYTYPWTSRTRNFEYVALAPGPDARRPKVIARGKSDDSAFWQEGFSLRAEPDAFTVLFSVRSANGLSLESRVHEWRRQGDAFRYIRAVQFPTDLRDKLPSGE
jgi:hypothetical protein